MGITANIKNLLAASISVLTLEWVWTRAIVFFFWQDPPIGSDRTLNTSAAIVNLLGVEVPAAVTGLLLLGILFWSIWKSVQSGSFVVLVTFLPIAIVNFLVWIAILVTGFKDFD